MRSSWGVDAVRGGGERETAREEYERRDDSSCGWRKGRKRREQRLLNPPFLLFLHFFFDRQTTPLIRTEQTNLVSRSDATRKRGEEVWGRKRNKVLPSSLISETW